jgi:hypothetical protein
MNCSTLKICWTPHYIKQPRQIYLLLLLLLLLYAGYAMPSSLKLSN